MKPQFKLLCLALVLLTLACAPLQQHPAGAAGGLSLTTSSMRLWPGGTPNRIPDGVESTDANATTVHDPMLYAYPLAHTPAPPAAVLIFPGGGYQHLSMTKEGSNVAHWLNQRGIAAFVLKYRHNPYRYPVPLQDAEEAMRVVRKQAAAFNIDPNRIGIWGFSDGGHLAAIMLDNINKDDPANAPGTVSARPNFAILGYPVINMNDDSIVHGGSRMFLLGQDFTPAQADALSAELHVWKSEAPVFLFAARNDKTVPPENSIRMDAALKKAGMDSTLVFADQGGHGFGLTQQKVDDALGAWLLDHKFATSNPPTDAGAYLKVALSLAHAPVQVPAGPIHVFIAGDSTASIYKPELAPRMGWGQVFGRLFDPEKVEVVDAAESGRSSKSFIDEGWLAKIKQQIKPGDYLFIQFGHNDEKTIPALHTEPATTYPQTLRQYIDVARAAHAHPVLLTSIARRKFVAGKISNTHDGYPDAVRKLAADEHVPLIDITAKSTQLFDSLGDAKTKDYFLYLPAGSPNYPDGAHDDTHFQERGALAIAGLVADGIREDKLPIANDLKQP